MYSRHLLSSLQILVSSIFVFGDLGWVIFFTMVSICKAKQTRLPRPKPTKNEKLNCQFSNIFKVFCKSCKKKTNTFDWNSIALKLLKSCVVCHKTEQLFIDGDRMQFWLCAPTLARKEKWNPTLYTIQLAKNPSATDSESLKFLSVLKRE